MPINNFSESLPAKGSVGYVLLVSIGALLPWLVDAAIYDAAAAIPWPAFKDMPFPGMTPIVLQTAVPLYLVAFFLGRLAAPLEAVAAGAMLAMPCATAMKTLVPCPRAVPDPSVSPLVHLVTHFFECFMYDEAMWLMAWPFCVMAWWAAAPQLVRKIGRAVARGAAVTHLALDALAPPHARTLFPWGTAVLVLVVLLHLGDQHDWAWARVLVRWGFLGSQWAAARGHAVVRHVANWADVPDVPDVPGVPDVPDVPVVPVASTRP